MDGWMGTMTKSEGDELEFVEFGSGTERGNRCVAGEHSTWLDVAESLAQALLSVRSIDGADRLDAWCAEVIGKLEDPGYVRFHHRRGRRYKPVLAYKDRALRPRCSRVPAADQD